MKKTSVKTKLKTLPLCLAVFTELGFAGVSARIPKNLPVLALALSASRRLLTAYPTCPTKMDCKAVEESSD